MTEQHSSITTFLDRSNDTFNHSISTVLTDGSCKRRRQRSSLLSSTSFPTKLQQGILSNRPMTQRPFRLTTITTTTTNTHQTHQLLPNTCTDMNRLRLLHATPITTTISILLFFLLLLSLQFQPYIGGHAEAFIPLSSTTKTRTSSCTSSRCISGNDSRVRTERYYIHHNHYPHENGSSTTGSSAGSNSAAAVTTPSPIHEKLSSSSSKGTIITTSAVTNSGSNNTNHNSSKKKKKNNAVKRSSKTGSRIIESIEEYIAIMTLSSSSSSYQPKQQHQLANDDNDDLNTGSSTACNSHSTTTTRNKPILLYWTAPWCGPCRLSQPIIQDINRMYTTTNNPDNDNNEDIVVTYEINTDELEDLANAVGITSIPTIQIYEPLVLDDDNGSDNTTTNNNNNKNTNPRRKLHDTFVGCVGTKQVLISSIDKLLEDIEKKKISNRKAPFLPTSSSSTGATTTTTAESVPLIC